MTEFKFSSKPKENKKKPDVSHRKTAMNAHQNHPSSQINMPRTIAQVARLETAGSEGRVKMARSVRARRWGSQTGREPAYGLVLLEHRVDGAYSALGEADGGQT
jgi:hypothetical protein